MERSWGPMENLLRTLCLHIQLRGKSFGLGAAGEPLTFFNQIVSGVHAGKASLSGLLFWLVMTSAVIHWVSRHIACKSNFRAKEQWAAALDWAEISVPELYSSWQWIAGFGWHMFRWRLNIYRDNVILRLALLSTIVGQGSGIL